MFLLCNRPWALGLVVVATLFAGTSCGGAAGGPGPGGAGQGLVLISFIQGGIDNVALNTRLEMRFSEPVNVGSIHTASIQIRQGSAFGITVAGQFIIAGDTVFFEPVLPKLCDYSDAGLQPDTQYRVQLVGHPEEFAIENTAGQKLNQTSTHEFTTRVDTDPNLFTDLVPAFAPSVVSSTPVNGDQAVAVLPAGGGPGTIEVVISENLDPCSVSALTVLFEMYEIGDPALGNGVLAPNGNLSGFFAAAPITPGQPTADQVPGDLFTWGADTFTPVGPAQTIPAAIDLLQDFTSTRIVITPAFGQFPDNALLVLRLTFDILDFGGQPLTPFEMAFTTENNPLSAGTYVMEVLGETPFLKGVSTADVNTARAPSNIQGFLLFSGDGDNGAFQDMPSGPYTSPACVVPLQANNGNRDEFDPAADILLDTGPTNICPNSADGSTAVI